MPSDFPAPKALRGFTVSWFFAPYLGSADLDLFKRLKDTHCHYDVVQVQRVEKDERVLAFATRATFDRFEVPVGHLAPRTREARAQFEAAVLQRFRSRTGDYDFLLSHSNEVPSHAAAWRVKQLAPRLPWIAYFGDVVAANPYVRHMQPYPMHEEDSATEALTLRHADVVILNNEHQRRLMFSKGNARHAHKAVVIPHCFDPQMFPSAPKATPSERFTFMHLGTLYHVKRTASPVFRGVDRLLQVYPAYQGRFEVVFYGSACSREDVDTWSRMRHRDHVRLEPSVPYLDSLELMHQADALLVIDGLFDRDTDGLDFSPYFPGKLADYMGAGRGILAVTMGDGPTADILRASGNLVADASADRIAYVLKQYIDRRVAFDTSRFERFQCTTVGAQMEAVLREAVARSRA